jgi:hypothetical protein
MSALTWDVTAFAGAALVARALRVGEPLVPLAAVTARCSLIAIPTVVLLLIVVTLAVGARRACCR